MVVHVTDNIQLSTTSAAVCGLCTLFILRVLFFGPKSSNAPVVGMKGPIGSWITAFKSLTGAHLLYREGYEKHKSGAYTVHQLGTGSLVLIAGEKIRDELRKAPDHALSMKASTRRTLATDYTMGPNIMDNEYHAGMVTTYLTKNIEVLFPDVYEELQQSCTDELPVPEDGQWATFRLGDPLRRVVSRTTNRILVGLPLCRDPEWRDLQISFTVSIVTDATLINMFPNFLKPWIGKYLARGPRNIKTAMKHLTPVIDERLNLPAEDRPNDFLTWLMQEAPKYPGEMTHEALTLRILVLNFSAIHTTSMTAMSAIYDLAARPEYAAPLREEVEEMTEKYGWTKKAVSQMKKLDSFVRESQRLKGLGTSAMFRMALKDYTFSDGTFIPAGTTVAAPSQAIQTDPAFYENPTEFDGFRFSKLPDGENLRNQMVSGSNNMLVFGGGHTLCPGRFFAANEIKCLLAHLVVTYDMKMKEEGVEPAPMYVTTSIVPNEKAEICFRKRS